MVVQRSAVTVTAVRVAIAYSDSFGNPRFIEYYEPVKYSDRKLLSETFLTILGLKTWNL